MLNLVLRSDPNWRGLKALRTMQMPEHTVTECFECGAPIVWLPTRRGNKAPVSPEQARGCTEFDGNMISHWASCPAYKKPTGKNVHPLAHTVPTGSRPLDHCACAKAGKGMQGCENYYLLMALPHCKADA